ncbi:MAG: TIGR04255 family protein [Nanoarchaeota archaeon]|nr:TIGR04255 family protein [Nanoarchaeota archaeon]
MIRYNKNFLTKVIFKLDFTEISNYKNKLKEFQTTIKKEFPILEEVKGVEIENVFGEPKASGLVRWAFSNKTKEKIITFDSNNIILEFKKYKNFDEFFKLVELIVNSLFKVFSSIIPTRLGLRYINKIEIDDKDPFNWNGLLNKSLLNSLDFVKVKKNLSRYMNMIEFNKDEDYKLRFQYGIANSLYPSQIMKKEFTLDYDCFTLESLENKEVLDKTKQFNEVITETFEESIDEGLRRMMGEIKDE